MYICLAKAKEVEDYFGNKIEEPPRALYYSKNLHRQRIYRSSYPEPHSNDFRLFKHKNKDRAQKLCDLINYAYNDDFKPTEVDV